MQPVTVNTSAGILQILLVGMLTVGAFMLGAVSSIYFDYTIDRKFTIIHAKIDALPKPDIENINSMLVENSRELIRLKDLIEENRLKVNRLTKKSDAIDSLRQ